MRLLGGSSGDEHAVRIAEFILARRLSIIKKRDIQQNYTALRPSDRQGYLYAAMRVLEDHGWVKPMDDNTSWKVNPAVHDGILAKIAEAERLRRAAVSEARFGGSPGAET